MNLFQSIAGMTDQRQKEKLAEWEETWKSRNRSLDSIAQDMKAAERRHARAITKSKPWLCAYCLKDIGVPIPDSCPHCGHTMLEKPIADSTVDPFNSMTVRRDQVLP